MARRRLRDGKYTISAIAEMFEIHPQTLRLYEREGLLEPGRSEGRTRLYSEEDIERLEVILTLTRDMGVNLAGVEIILDLRRKLVEAVDRLSQLEELLQSDAFEELKARMEDATAEQAALIPARAAKLVRIARRDK
ncbi:MAG: MerR family transcriptional regulator [Candidatus Tectomicrobia bacterium]|uniref:MerR family transcriptional regulator n=1 Tax=Tectimicrobiota bacterium TaxID=2528274 RepID=A0A932MM67_UNCTE|nr:MerR family transcriptional regulator [Candidatus Tectomicrobia bacterium]